MQHLQALSQKFVIEGQNQSEIFIYHPLTESQHNLGNLYILGEIDAFGQKNESRAILLNAIASVIKKTYYSFSGHSNVASAIELTLRKTSIHFKSLLKNFRGSLHLLIIVISGNRIFFAKSGKANIWLIRGGKWTLISQSAGATPRKNLEWVLFNHIFTGKIMPSDFFVAVTPKIIPYIMQESFKIKVNSLPFESTLSFLKKNIKEVDPTASASILKIDIKEPPLAIDHYRREQPELEALNEVSNQDQDNIGQVYYKDRPEKKRVFETFYYSLKRRPFLLNAIGKKYVWSAALIIFLIIFALQFISKKGAEVKNNIKPQDQPITKEQNVIYNYANIIKDYNFQELADFSSIGFLVNPQVMVNAGESIYLLDGNLHLKFAVNDGSLTTSFLENSINSNNFFGSHLPFTANIFIASPSRLDAVILFNIFDKSSKIFKINFPDENIVIKDVSIYGSNLYFLTSASSLIYRAPISLSFSVGSPQKWMKDDTSKILNNPLSFAIDSNLYILDSNGAVIKFFKGKKTAVFQNETGLPLGADAKIYTDQTIKNLYIADPLNSRIIILSKDGKNFSQIARDELKGTRLISISSDEKTIYAANSSGLFQITLP